MSVSRVAGRYAKSLMDLAIERGLLSAVVEDMKTVKGAIAASRDLQLLLQSPIITAEKKEQILKAIFADKLDATTMAFINICVSKSREGLLADIAAEVLAEYKKMQGITTVKVTTARPIDSASVEAIRQKLIASSDTRADVEIETAVNADLIGGFVVEFGDKLFDASVAHKLDVLRKGFSHNAYESKIEKHGTV